jgi:hypothetical protein
MNRDVWAKNVWEALHGRPGFTFSSPLVQLFHPHSGKGYALLKPTGTDRSDKTKDRWAEPFLEWLRFRGYFEGSAGWFTAGDLRLFCPIPADIPYDQFVATAAAFRELQLGGTAVKVDCRAILGLVRLLIEGAKSYRRPCRSIRGVWVTHYKDMGQAHTFMAMEQLAIPDWFSLRTAEQAKLWLRTLEVHETALRRLNDTHSDEFALLKQYRRTFQTRRDNSVKEFVEFLRDYGILLFRKRARDHWLLPQFPVESVSAILGQEPELRTILHNPGFLAAAAAVRSSTVGAQGARRNGRVDHREIRYGLLSDIHRADSLGRPQLLQEVFSFIASFNREGLRRRAAGVPSRLIENKEIRTFAALAERLPVHTRLGSLLCGIAVCRTGAAVTTESEPAQAQVVPA